MEKNKRRRALKGDGSIFKDKHNGGLIYQYVDNAGKKHQKKFADTPEGKRQMNEFIKNTRNEVRDGFMVESITLGEWISQYIEIYKKPKLRESSYIRMKQSAAKIPDSLWNTPLNQVQPVMIQNTYNALLDTMSTSSVSKVHKLMVSAFKKAAASKMVRYDPMVAVESVRVKTKDIEIFTFAEILNLFRAIRRIENDPKCAKLQRDYHTLFMLLLTTGMRAGELLALRWEDVDFTRREIHVHASNGHSGRTSVITETKTKAGNRLIPILSDACYNRLNRLRKADGVLHIKGFIFATSTGKALSYGNLFRVYQHIQEEAGFTKTLHCFRHTFATTLLAKGVPILEVSRILGHTEASTTLNLYGHSIPSYNTKLIEQFSRSQKKVAAESKKIIKVVKRAK